MSDPFDPRDDLDPDRTSPMKAVRADEPPVRMSERSPYPTRASLRGREPRPNRPAAAPAPATISTRVQPQPVPQPVPQPAPGRHLPRTVAALVALAGALLIGAGILQGTVFKAPTTTTASIADPPGTPIVVSEPGLMGLDGPRVQITVNGASNKPVFLGIGRAADIEAYLAKVERLTLTGEDGNGVLTTTSAGTEATLPDPAAADVWVVSQRARGAASLNWPEVSGQWVVVAATDGSAAAPAKITLTWTGRKAHSSGAGFIAVGAVLLVCGLVLLIMLISRARQETPR